MDLLQTEEVATVVLFDLRLSEGDLQYFALAVEYALTHLDDSQLQRYFDAGVEDVPPSETREILEDRLQQLMSLIQEHCRSDLLDEYFLNWKGPAGE
jgi:hypothetical protein